MSPVMRGTLLVTAVVVFAMVFVGSTSAEGSQPSVEEWYAALQDGGVLVLSTQGHTENIPVHVSSVFEVPDELPTIVLRGQVGTSSASVVLKHDGAYGFANLADGHSYRWSQSGTTSASALASDSLNEGLPGPVTGTMFVDQVQALPPDDDTAEDYVTTFADCTSYRANELIQQVIQSMDVAPFGGHSIKISKHIWQSDPDCPIDPSNVIFYDETSSSMAETVVEAAGWDKTTCGKTKWLYFFDAQHSGSDDWDLMDEGDDGHFEKDRSGQCENMRYHLRRFTSATGDTHNPGFGDFTVLPVHWEDDGHDVVNPLQGQDYLLADMATSEYVGEMWSIEVANSASDCMNCALWDGRVDIYQIRTDNSNDPCGLAPPIGITTIGSFVRLEWGCGGHIDP